MEDLRPLLRELVGENYANISHEALRSISEHTRILLSQRSIPEASLPDLVIEHILNELALMDSNNYTGKVGFGEREGRVASGLVARRHYYMSHGVGRSGDLVAL